MSDSSKKPWLIKSTKELFKTRAFRLRCDELVMPDGRVMPRYYTMDFVDWVNVVPVTREGQLVMIRQYRPPSEAVMIEFPGGSVDIHPSGPSASEPPEQAARRELLEETGYEPQGSLILLGHHFPNPALQSNRLWTFLANDCVKVAEQKLDQYEALDVVLMSVSEVMALSRSGGIAHSLMLASLHLAEPHLEALAGFEK